MIWSDIIFGNFQVYVWDNIGLFIIVSCYDSIIMFIVANYSYTNPYEPSDRLGQSSQVRNPLEM